MHERTDTIDHEALNGGADNRSFHFTQIVRAQKYDRVPHASVCEACGF